MMLLSLIIVFVFSFRVFLSYSYTASEPISMINLNPLIDSLEKYEKESKEFGNAYPTKNKSTQKNSAMLFAFDPNEISVEDAVKLGIPVKIAKRLALYREKGGKFKQPNDLKKLYGLNEKTFEKLKSYIVIAERKEIKPSTTPEKRNPSKKVLVDINLADSVSLVSINGVGPATARKIIRFRNALGGFHSKIQLKEIYGMRDSIYALIENQIIVDSSSVNKININTIAIVDLKKHAYINHQVANAIVNYRTKHGLYLDLNSLLKTGVVSTDLLHKIRPYLTL